MCVTSVDCYPQLCMQYTEQCRATHLQFVSVIVMIMMIIIIIIFVYYSCSHNATTEPPAVTQDSTDTIEHKASIYNET